MEYFVKPYKHQEDLLEMSRNMSNIAVLWGLGCGKTGGMILVLRDKFNTERRIMRTLIIGPVSILYGWRNELLKFSRIPDQMIAVLTAKERKKEHKEPIRIVNYDALVKKDFLEILLEFKPEIIVFDETQLIKNPTAKRTKACIALSKLARFRFLLTGTPIAKNTLDLFSQWMCLDQGETLGRNFFVFRGSYFQDRNASFARSANYFPNWQPIPALYPVLLEKIHQKAIVVKKEEVLDLPPRIEVDKFIELTDEQKVLYKKLKEEFIAYVEELDASGQPKAVVAQLAITKLIRLRQLLSGFLVLDDGTTLLLKQNPRLDALEEVLEEVADNYKVIVWCVFKEEYKMISSLCSRLKLGYVMVHGTIDADQKQLNIDAFQTDPNVRVLIGNRKSAGTGTNMQAAAYSVDYSKTYSLLEFLQAKDRNYRGGSEIHEQIVNVTITAQGTIDEEALKALKDKKEISDMVLNFVKEDV